MRFEIPIEPITPLFLGGVEQRQPELRPASVRGALRYWLRALLGAVVGTDLGILRQEERRVFGSTEGVSTITVRLAGSLPRFGNFDLDRDQKKKQLLTG